MRLPDVHITDKNDTFHLNGDTYSSFRLIAKAVKRDLYGNPVPVDDIQLAVSAKFIVGYWGRARSAGMWHDMAWHAWLGAGMAPLSSAVFACERVGLRIPCVAAPWPDNVPSLHVRAGVGAEC